MALTEQGMEPFAGVSGQADEAVEKYIKGKLTIIKSLQRAISTM